MSRINDGPMGSHVEHALPLLPRALTLEYYRQVDRELEQRKLSRATQAPKPNKNAASSERRSAIAADIRAGLTTGQIKEKWRASRALLDSIIGDMYIGKL